MGNCRPENLGVAMKYSYDQEKVSQSLSSSDFPFYEMETVQRTLTGQWYLFLNLIINRLIECNIG